MDRQTDRQTNGCKDGYINGMDNRVVEGPDRGAGGGENRRREEKGREAGFPRRRETGRD